MQPGVLMQLNDWMNNWRWAEKIHRCCHIVHPVFLCSVASVAVAFNDNVLGHLHLRNNLESTRRRLNVCGTIFRIGRDFQCVKLHIPLLLSINWCLLALINITAIIIMVLLWYIFSMVLSVSCKCLQFNHIAKKNGTHQINEYTNKHRLLLYNHLLFLFDKEHDHWSIVVMTVCKTQQRCARSFTRMRNW